MKINLIAGLLLSCFLMTVSAVQVNKALELQNLTEQKSISEYSIEALLAKIFSPIPNIRDFTMTSDRKEIYITIQNYKKQNSAIVRIFEENAIIKKEIASFSGQYKDLEPMLSPSGLQLFYVSNRPLNSDSTEVKDMDIWMVERMSLTSNWSAPKNLGNIINTDGEEFYPSISKNGNLYFTGERADSKGKEDIYVSKFVDGKYTLPTSLSTSINTEGYEFNSFIAPDESYLIFSGYNRADGLGSADLYISYQDQNGNWSSAKNLGELVNSKSLDYCPFVDVSKSTLYFTSERQTETMVNSPQNLEQYLKGINQYQNGLSRIYAVPFKDK